MGQSWGVEKIAGVQQEKVGHGVAPTEGASRVASRSEAHFMPGFCIRVQFHNPCEDDSELDGCAGVLMRPGATGKWWVNVITAKGGVMAKHLGTKDLARVDDVRLLICKQLTHNGHQRAIVGEEAAAIWQAESLLTNLQESIARPHQIQDEEKLGKDMRNKETRILYAEDQITRWVTFKDLKECFNECKEDLARALHEKEQAQDEREVAVSLLEQVQWQATETAKDLQKAMVDLQKAMVDLALKKEELENERVETERLQQREEAYKEQLAMERTRFADVCRDFHTCEEDLAHAVHEMEQAQHEKQVAVQRAQEELARSRTSTPIGQAWHFQLADGTWTPFDPHDSDVLTKSLQRGEESCAILHGRIQYKVKFEGMVPKICPAEGGRAVTCSFGLPSHWSGHSGGVLKQIGVFKEEPNGLFLCFGRQQPSFSFEDVAQHITNDGILEMFTKLLRNSVFHHDDRIPRFASTMCSDLKERIDVCEAYHIENLSLYEAYQDHCKSLQLKHSVHGVVPEPISPDRNPALKELAQQMGIQMWAPHECLLFHGTSSDAAEKIALGGFDIYRARSGLYGKGAYFAAQSCKSHQYASPIRKQGQDVHTVIVARVALGDPYYCKKGDSSCSSPPAKFDGGPLSDSLIAQPGRMPGHHFGHQTHAEFIVFEREQVYPEYILKYHLR